MPVKMNLADLAEAARKSGVPEITAEELVTIRPATPDLLLIDVRQPEERARGHIPDSLFVPRGVLERDIEKKAFAGHAQATDLARPIVLYCGGGHRSLLGAESLIRMGFTRVSSLAGGFSAWHRAGLPVEGGEGEGGEGEARRHGG